MNIAMIRAARARAEGNIRRTPILSAPALDAIAGRRVLVKAECLQHTGSFKARGGWAAVSALAPEVRAPRHPGLFVGQPRPGRRPRRRLARRAGGHRDAVRRAAGQGRGHQSAGAPRWCPTTARTGDREAMGAALAAERGLTLVRPYDEPEVIAGQGTCGLEVAEDARALGIEVADVLVCCGGGGLTSGIALALEAEGPGLRARPVEPEGFDDVARSLRSGRREVNAADPSASICDAIVTPSPGEVTFPILSRLCGPGLAVTEDEALRAMALALRHLKIVLEPGGAVSLAAALFRPETIAGETVIVVASGGNADPAMIARALASG